MRQRSMTRAMVAGFIATLAMVFLGFIGTHFGMPALNWATALETYFGGNATFGYAMFFVLGVLLAVVYVAFFHERLPGTSWKRGIFFATIMWVLTGLILAPVLHMGFFMGSVWMAVGTLATYWAYGALLGFIYDV